MLVLSRKHNESVAVGGVNRAEPILIVKVLEIKSRTVLLGFEANGDVPVHRWEVWERIVADVPMSHGSGRKPQPKAHGCAATTCAAAG